MAYQIDLIERGRPEIIPADQWRRKNLESSVVLLAEKGVVSIQYSRVGVILAAGSYVGEVRLGDTIIRILPKSPRIFAAIEELALQHDAKEARHLDERGDKKKSTEEADLAKLFVSALSAVVGDGIPWEYQTHEEVTSRPRGRIDLGATIRKLASRGIHHKVVTLRPAPVQHAQFVRVVRAALLYLPRLRKSSPEVLRDAAILAEAFDDADAYRSPEDAVADAESLLPTFDGNDRKIAAELVWLSLQVLTAKSVSLYDMEAIPGSVARFVSMERLWELCVAKMTEVVLARRVPDAAVTLHALRGCEVGLFEDGGPKLDPDLVVHQRGQIVAVLDAKYKRRELTTSGIASDLYQLNAYACRTGAKTGVLVHFSDESSGIKRVGTTSTGAGIFIATISPDFLLGHGIDALNHIVGKSPFIGEGEGECFAHSLSK